MKKAILLIAVLLLVGSFVFAQDAGVKIGAWGRGVFIPVQGGSIITALDQTSWGGVPRVGMTISGTSANAGFQVDFNGDNNGIGAGDQQKIWIKPLDMLTVQLGRIFDDTLRGNAGAYGAWNWVRYAGMHGEDAVFGRLGVNGQQNVAFSLAPVEGLYVFGGVNGILGSATLVNDAYVLNGQYGAGYTIAGIGTLRAQFIGKNGTTLAGVIANKSQFNAAFKLTAVEKLTVDVGAYIPVDAVAANSVVSAALGLSYGLDALTINAMGFVDAPQAAGANLKFEAGAGIDYSLGDGVGVMADFRYQNDALAGNTSGVIAGMAAISKGFSNGLIGIGVEVTTGTFAGGNIVKAKADDPAWMIPVRFEYWF